MANPGHALAANNMAEIHVLKAEVTWLKNEYRVNVELVSRQTKALAQLLKKKGVLTEDEAAPFENFEVTALW